MICFWVTRSGSFGIEAYRDNRGRDIADRFHVSLYEETGETARFPACTQIYAALDRLTPQQREIASLLYDAHARVAPHAARLNDPRRTLRRFELLQALHASGINAYRVYHATEWRTVNRFPVFIRHMHDHDGPRTPLLFTRGQVFAALCGLVLKGFHRDDLMVVEFCDTSRQGMYRKLSAFNVGGRIMASHLLESRRWCVKSAHDEPNVATLEEGLRFVHENPHEAWLRRVFAVAHTDYGRVDYGIVDGVPQVWEINLNPTIGRAPGSSRKPAADPRVQQLREETRGAFHAQLRAAFVQLDSADPAEEVQVSIDSRMQSTVRREAAAQRRRDMFRTGARAIYDSPPFRVPARAIARLLRP